MSNWYLSFGEKCQGSRNSFFFSLQDFFPARNSPLDFSGNIWEVFVDLGFIALAFADESFSVAEKSLEDFATTADFLIHTWHKQRKDRAFLLQYEKVLEDILNAKEEQPYFSPCLNSYYRMLLHRLAEVWGFEHMICSVGNQPRISLKLTAESRV